MQRLCRQWFAVFRQTNASPSPTHAPFLATNEKFSFFHWLNWFHFRDFEFFLVSFYVQSDFWVLGSEFDTWALLRLFTCSSQIVFWYFLFCGSLRAKLLVTSLYIMLILLDLMGSRTRQLSKWEFCAPFWSVCYLGDGRWGKFWSKSIFLTQKLSEMAPRRFSINFGAF